jgi:hypothetical protein
LHPSHSDLCIIASQVGMSYKDLIQAIVSSASARHGLRRRSFEEKKGRYSSQPTSLPRARKLASIS